MKTIKVSEATNIQLDWLVWKCAGGIDAYPKTGSGKAFLKLWNSSTAKYVHPTTDWSQMGPIMERRKSAHVAMCPAARVESGRQARAPQLKVQAVCGDMAPHPSSQQPAAMWHPNSATRSRCRRS
jgi:hypothetical protein